MLWLILIIAVVTFGPTLYGIAYLLGVRFKQKTTWSKAFYIADKKLNKLADGSNHTVSARIGYHVSTSKSRYWMLCQRFVDWAFKPYDGHLTGLKGHCLYWYSRERLHSPNFKNVDGFERYALAWVVIVTSLTLGVAFRLRRK